MKVDSLLGQLRAFQEVSAVTPRLTDLLCLSVVIHLVQRDARFACQVDQ